MYIHYIYIHISPLPSHCDNFPLPMWSWILEPDFAVQIVLDQCVLYLPIFLLSNQTKYLSTSHKIRVLSFTVKSNGIRDFSVNVYDIIFRYISPMYAKLII